MMGRRDRYESRIGSHFPSGSVRLPEDPPKKNMIKFILFMIWQTILHGRNRR